MFKAQPWLVTEFMRCLYLPRHNDI
jgi:hypothetical protein